MRKYLGPVAGVLAWSIALAALSGFDAMDADRDERSSELVLAMDAERDSEVSEAESDRSQAR